MRHRNLPTAQLREPATAARTEIDDGGLHELADSIRALGILQPLIVRPRPDSTYEVVAGHRRLLAARALDMPEVPCVILGREDQLHAARSHENAYREELSPTDEAIYFAELYEQCGNDVDKVADLVRRPREHVERRLLLLQGDPEVLKALRVGCLSLGVAEEINRIRRPEDRAYYLAYAIKGGCSIRQAREWRAAANTRADIAEAEPAPEAAPGAAPVEGAEGAPPAAGAAYIHMARPNELSAARDERECLFCGTREQEWRMFRKFVCGPCADRVLVDLERRRA